MQRRSIALIAALVLTVFVMRGPITSVGPVAKEITEELSMSYSLYGLLTCLPVLCLGLFSVFTPRLTRMFKTETVFCVIVGAVFAGCLFRLAPSTVMLFLGTVILAGGISMLNTIVPVFLRQYVPIRTSLLLGGVTAGLGLSSCCGVFFSVPLMHIGGSYLYAIGIWAVLSGAALFLFLTQKKGVHPLELSNASTDFSLLKKIPVWGVILTMGMQSVISYSVAAWLPVLARTEGLSFTAAGFCATIFLLATIPASLFIDPMIRLFRGEGVLSAVMTALALAGTAMWLFGGTWLFIGSIFAGFAQGARYSLAIILISKKSPSSAQMVSLSALVQGMGYCFGGMGPLLCGFFYTWLGNGSGIYAFLFAVAAIWGVSACYSFSSRCKVFR